MWWALATWWRGALRNQNSLKAPTVSGIEQAAGRGERDPGQRPGGEGPGPVGLAPQPGGQVLEPGVVTAGEDGATQPAAGRLAVDPGHRVPVGVVPGAASGP